MAQRSHSNEFAVLLDESGQNKNRVAIGKLQESEILKAQAYHPILALGPQRSGKTSSLVIPAVLEWDGPVLVTSVRYDVVEETITAREKKGEVWVYDPANTVPAKHAGVASGWNPVSELQSWDDCVRRAAAMCEGTTYDSGDLNFWLMKARQLIAPLLFASAMSTRTIGEVIELLSREQSDLVWRVKELIKLGSRSDLEKGSASLSIDQIVGNTSDTRVYNSIQTTATSVLAVFDYLEVKSRADSGEINVERFLNGDSNTLYVCAPVQDQRLYRPLFTALVDEVLRAVYIRNEGDGLVGRLPFFLCLDEAGNVARIEDLDVYATTVSGTGIQLLSVFHDISQMVSVYGVEKSNLILNNHSATLFFPGNRDPRSAEYVNSLLQGQSVRRHTHQGWSSGDLRIIEEDEVLVIYRSLPAFRAFQRRYYDEEVGLGVKRAVSSRG